MEENITSIKRVLMIAYHFPPIQGSSGVHRTVQFARHLPSFGWSPIIVSPHPRAYPLTGDSLWAQLPEKSLVKRAFAMDSARHLAIKGRYLGFTAIPDRWVSWWPAGVLECLRLIKKYRPRVLWSTFPIATAHLIGLTVQRLTGLPWVADFRDPMVQNHSPSSRLIRKFYLKLEKEIFDRASCCTFVTRSACKDYRLRNPEKDEASWQVIENGYDESLFEPFSSMMNSPVKRAKDQPIKILHSGLLYSSGRNPLPFFEALSSCLPKIQNPFEIILRGSGIQLDIKNLISSLNLEDTVKIVKRLSYADAIQEMIEADGFLLFQGAEFNKQIPAKLYEYIRAGKPILALVDERGETAEFLKKWDGVHFADTNSPAEIESAFIRLLVDIYSGRKIDRDAEAVNSLSRKAGTVKLAQVLNSITGERQERPYYLLD